MAPTRILLLAVSLMIGSVQAGSVGHSLISSSTGDRDQEVWHSFVHLTSRRRLAQSGTSNSKFTKASSYTGEDLSTSPSLQALASVVQRRSWFENLQVCWAVDSSNNSTSYADNPACSSTLASSAMELGNAVLSNFTWSSELCDRKSRPKVSIPVLLSNPTSMTGLYMSALDAWRLNSDVIPSVWIAPTAPDAETTLDECGNLIKSGATHEDNPDGTTASGQSADREKTHTGSLVPPDKGFYAGFVDVAAKTYKEGYAKGASNWMNTEIGVKAPGSELPVGLTYPQNIFLLMYRKDWFDALNIQPPNTWSELMSLAAALSQHPQFIKTVGSETGAGRTNWDQGAEIGPEQERPFTEIIARANAVVPGTTPRNETRGWPAPGTPARVYHQAHFFGETPENVTDSRLKRKLQEEQPASAEPELIPLCLDLAPYCKAGDYLAAISASIIQSQGVQQGYVLDPVTLEPVGNSLGAKLAMAIYKELVSLALPLKPMRDYQPMTSCEAISRPFALGKCAMTIEWDVVWPYVYNLPLTNNATHDEMAGNLGVSPIPGSATIWNWATNKLEQCTSDLCPWSEQQAVATYQATASTTPSTKPKDFKPDMLSATTSSVWVNRAPYAANFDREGWVCNPVDYMEKLDYTLQVFDAAIKRTTEAKRTLSGLMKAIFLRLMQKRNGAPPPPPVATNTTAASPPATTTDAPAPAPAVNGTDSNSTSAAAAPTPAVSSTVPTTPGAYPTVTGTPTYPPTYPGGRRLQWAPSSDYMSQPETAGARLPRKRRLQQSEPSMIRYPPLSQLAYDIGNQYGPPPIAELNATIGELVTPLVDKLSMRPVNLADVMRVLETLWRIQFKLSANTATQVVLTPATTGAFQQSFFELAHYLITVSNATLTNAASGIVQRHKFSLTLEPGGVNDVTNALWQVTGYTPPPSPPPAPAATIVVNQQEDRTTFPLAGIIAIPVVVTVVIGLLAAGVLAYSRRSRYVSWKGDVLPPGAGSGTTLLYTNIQDSLMLWDSLSPAVVDDAVSEYHSVIRSVAATHNGYECSVEGDSVILAFHTARAAASFAVEVQQELLLANWPKDLLQLEVCRPVWVRPHGKNAKKGKTSKGLKGPGNVFDTSLDQQGVADEDTGALMPPAQRLESHIGWWRAKNFSRVSMEASMSLQSHMSRTAPNSGGSMVVAHLDDPFYAAGGSPLEWSALTSKLSLTPDLPYLQPLEATASMISIQTIGMNDDANSEEEHEDMFVRDKLLQLAPLAPGGGPSCILLFRGLRVSIGMASGVDRADDITRNHPSGRVQYGGALADVARAVQAAAPGGQSLAAMSTFVQLPLEDMRGQVVAMEMGSHCLQDVPDTVHLYQLLPPTLMFRAAHFTPVQSVSQESLGAPQAPCNNVAAAFMNIVGMSLLKAHDSALAAASIKVFQKVSESHLARLGGYLQMSSDGLCLTAFSHPAEAVRWALDTIEACLVADWPEELLNHELGEVLKVPIMATHHMPGADVLPMASTPHTPLMTSQRTSVKRLGTRTSAPMELDERGSPLVARPRSSKHSSTCGDPETPGLRASVDGNEERATKGDYGRVKKWPMVVHKVVLRGLRMKCGIDYGPVRSGVHGVTARITYSGRVLNRAARVSQTAKTGQVWLTEAAWAVAKHEINVIPEAFDDELPVECPPEVAATHLGAFKLKGVADEINLVQTFFCDSGRNVQAPRGYSRYSNPILEGDDEH